MATKRWKGKTLAQWLAAKEGWRQYADERRGWHEQLCCLVAEISEYDGEPSVDVRVVGDLLGRPGGQVLRHSYACVRAARRALDWWEVAHTEWEKSNGTEA